MRWPKGAGCTCRVSSLLTSRPRGPPVARVSLLSLATVVLVVVLPCQAVFYSPPPTTSNLAKNVTVTCSAAAAGSCDPGLDAVTCHDAGDAVCRLTCPTRSDFPGRENPLVEWTSPANGSGCQWSNTTPVDADLPSAANGTHGFLDVNSSTTSCSLSKNVSIQSGRWSLSMWIKASCSGNCTIVQAVNIVNLRVAADKVCLTKCADRAISNAWTLLILQVKDGTVSVSVNGTLVGDTIPSATQTTNSAVSGTVLLHVGVTEDADALQDADSYLLSDVRLYDDLLTEREIQNLFTSHFMDGGLLSACRCPPTHLRLKTDDNYTCTDGTQEASRLHINYNEPSVLVDGSGKSWMGPKSGSFVLTIDLEETYQMESIQLEFMNKAPGSVEIAFPVGENSTVPCNGMTCSFSAPPLDPDTVTQQVFSTHVVGIVSVTLKQPGENIIINSVNITGRCNCNGNADVCDTSSTPYQCSCRQETRTEGNRCHVCQANSFPKEDAFGCQPCDCNSAGTTSNTECNKSTGQCQCKDFVEGRQCDVCKDSYYRLSPSQPKGCLPCDCHPVGSANLTCDKVSGDCPCLASLPETSRNCTPWLLTMEPNYGPLAGGTTITILGHLLGNSTQTPRVFVGGIPQSGTVDHNESIIVFRTSPHGMEETMNVEVSWQDADSAIGLPTNNGFFTYKPDPVLDRNSVPKVAMFVSGGCGVSFKGRNFRSVKTPHLVLTNNGTGDVHRTVCRHIGDELRCSTPDLAATDNATRSTLHLGLELDGITDTYLGQVQVMDDPTLPDAGDFKFQYPFEKTITIRGSGLIGGCSSEEVNVLIGVVGCSIKSLTSSGIECKPPSKRPGEIKKYPIMVKIGANIEKQVGMLVYLEFWETDIFIGVMCGIGGLILLVLFVIICCCCRTHRRKHRPTRGSQHIGLVDKDKKGANPQNQYSTLPQGAINNGFQGDPITAETVMREPKEAFPPTATEVDMMTEFLHRLEPSLWDGFKSSIITSNDLALGRVCTARGNYARIIDGTFATVTAGQRTEKKVTIKTLKEPLPEQGLLPAWAGAALRECLRLHRHSDDNVLSIIGLALDKQKFHMVYPFMQNRTLKDHIIDTNQEFSVRQLVEFGLQVSEGLNYLVEKDITHRDLATRNCMVDANREVKIADAAFSWDFYENEYVYDSDRERYMPVRWMAPESLMDGYYDMHSDVWSFGVLLWELLTRGCLPFHEVQDQSVKAYVLEGYVLGQPQNCSDGLYELMRQCWDPENEHRPHVSSVVKSLSTELTGGSVDQEDIYVNLGTVEGYYENQMVLGSKATRRKAPPPPRPS